MGRSSNRRSRFCGFKGRVSRGQKDERIYTFFKFRMGREVAIMKRAFCKKPCTIGGRAFTAGNEVPMELIEPSRQAALIQYGLIAMEEINDLGGGEEAERSKGRSGKRVRA